MPHLLLLHGALGARDQLAPLLPLLGDGVRPHSIDFEGHGAAAGRGRPFRIEQFAENVAEYVERAAIGGPVPIFGYSMGGYVALHLAATRPELVERVMTLGTKFQWTAESAARETGMLDPARIQAKVPQFARALAERHTASGWEDVLRRTAEMMRALGERPTLGAEELARVRQRVRIAVGDRDGMVSIDESAGAYRALPNAELEVLPGTPHPLEKISWARLARSVGEFFE
ncbi:MAG TPA: alpha/beta fold hydrolase [Gemmatimonadaceae bacterium]|nr:alpha/beta fold hydrolase [Gemmatimonadaceae bacterium]